MDEKEDLVRLRNGIDAVNLQLLRLLERRGELVLRIARLKQRRGTNILDPDREAEMLVRLAAQSQGVFDRREIEAVFRRIFAASRELAQRLISRAPAP